MGRKRQRTREELRRQQSSDTEQENTFFSDYFAAVRLQSTNKHAHTCALTLREGATSVGFMLFIFRILKKKGTETGKKKTQLFIQP